MGNLCSGGGAKKQHQHEVPNKHGGTDEGRLNPLNPPRPTAAAPDREDRVAAKQETPADHAAAASGATVPHTVREVDEWYNDLIRKLWPFINQAVTKMCMEMLPPLLEQSKPTWMTRLELTKFVLGPDPIVLTKLNVENGPDPGHDDIFLDFDIRWDTPNMDFELAVNPLPKFVAGIPGIKQATSITVGVEDFFLEGRVRISMVPLLKEIPVVGALQISLLGMPKFDMNLTLGVFDGLESTIKPWLKSFIEDYVLEAYEVPGHYFLPLANGIPDVQTPAGVLEFTVLEAVNVPKMDYLSQSSPYCKLWLTGAKKNAVKTPYVETTKNPQWDPERSTFAFPVHAPDHQQLVVALYDYDFGSADDEIGRTVVSIKDLGDEKVQDFWVSFETPEQRSERKKHEELKAQGMSDHNVKHRDQDGNKKGVVQRTQDAVVHALVPAAGGHDKQLPNCRVRIRAVYHSLDEADVKRMNQAQDAGRKPDLTMIHEESTRRVIEKHNLMDQIINAKKDPAGGAAAGTTAQGQDDKRKGEDSAAPQGSSGTAAAGSDVKRVQALGGEAGQPVGGYGRPGQPAVGVGGAGQAPAPAPAMGTGQQVYSGGANGGGANGGGAQRVPWTIGNGQPGPLPQARPQGGLSQLA